MRIRMVSAQLVAADGFRVERWAIASEHDVTPEHGSSLVAAGWAEAIVGPSETKVVEPAEPARGKRKHG